MVEPVAVKVALPDGWPPRGSRVGCGTSCGASRVAWNVVPAAALPLAVPLAVLPLVALMPPLGVPAALFEGFGEELAQATANERIRTCRIGFSFEREGRRGRP